uniref:J domain-containing protein n=1 Tax=Macrostomum lignano TaxID=282301 RepID=A0A1I8G8I7_9PLAT
MPKQSVRDLAGAEGYVSLANGSPIEIERTVLLRLSIADKVIDTPALVVSGVKYQLVLGSDFCRDNSCVIDYKTAVFSVQDTAIPFRWQAERPIVCRILATRSSTIPPGHQAVLSARLESKGRRNRGCVGLTENLGANDLAAGRWLAKALVIPNSGSRLPTRLINITEEPVRIRQGCTLGWFCPLESTEPLNTIKLLAVESGDDPQEEPKVQGSNSPSEADLLPNSYGDCGLSTKEDEEFRILVRTGNLASEQDQDDDLRTVKEALGSNPVPDKSETAWSPLARAVWTRKDDLVLQENVLLPVDSHVNFVKELEDKLQTAHRAARQQLNTYQRRQKDQYDKRTRGSDIQEGDHVFVYSPALKPDEAAKFHVSWLGPVKVLERRSEVLFKVENPSNRKKSKFVHFNNLRKFARPAALETPVRTAAPPEVVDETDSETEAECETWTRPQLMPPQDAEEVAEVLEEQMELVDDPQPTHNPVEAAPEPRRSGRLRRPPDRYGQPMDLYAVLQVGHTAERAEIRRVYRQLALFWHPDKHPDKELAGRRFQEIETAGRILSCPYRRAMYDQLGDKSIPYDEAVTFAMTFIPPTGVRMPADIEEGVQQRREVEEAQRKEAGLRQGRQGQRNDYEADGYILISDDDESEESDECSIDTEEEDELLASDGSSGSSESEAMEIDVPESKEVVSHRASGAIWDDEKLSLSAAARQLRHRLMKHILAGQSDGIVSVLTAMRRLFRDSQREPRSALSMVLLQALFFIRRDIAPVKRQRAGRRYWSRQSFDCFVRQLCHELIPLFGLRRPGRLLEVLKSCVGLPGLRRLLRRPPALPAGFCGGHVRFLPASAAATCASCRLLRRPPALPAGFCGGHVRFLPASAAATCASARPSARLARPPSHLAGHLRALPAICASCRQPALPARPSARPVGNLRFPPGHLRFLSATCASRPAICASCRPPACPAGHLHFLPATCVSCRPLARPAGHLRVPPGHLRALPAICTSCRPSALPAGHLRVPPGHLRALPAICTSCRPPARPARHLRVLPATCDDRTTLDRAFCTRPYDSVQVQILINYARGRASHHARIATPRLPLSGRLRLVHPLQELAIVHPTVAIRVALLKEAVEVAHMKQRAGTHLMHGCLQLVLSDEAVAILVDALEQLAPLAVPEYYCSMRRAIPAAELSVAHLAQGTPVAGGARGSKAQVPEHPPMSWQREADSASQLIEIASAAAAELEAELEAGPEAEAASAEPASESQSGSGVVGGGLLVSIRCQRDRCPCGLSNQEPLMLRAVSDVRLVTGSWIKLGRGAAREQEGGVQLAMTDRHQAWLELLNESGDAAPKRGGCRQLAMLKCLDIRSGGRPVYLSLADRCSASPVAGPDGISGVQQLRSLLDRLRLPLSVRPVPPGRPPLPWLPTGGRRGLRLSGLAQGRLLFFASLSDPDRLLVVTPEMLDGGHAFCAGPPSLRRHRRQLQRHWTRSEQFLRACHPAGSLRHLTERLAESTDKLQSPPQPPPPPVPLPQLPLTPVSPPPMPLTPVSPPGANIHELLDEVEDIYCYVRTGQMPQEPQPRVSDAPLLPSLLPPLPPPPPSPPPPPLPLRRAVASPLVQRSRGFRGGATVSQWLAHFWSTLIMMNTRINVGQEGEEGRALRDGNDAQDFLTDDTFEIIRSVSLHLKLNRTRCSKSSGQETGMEETAGTSVHPNSAVIRPAFYQDGSGGGERGPRVRGTAALANQRRGLWRERRWPDEEPESGGLLVVGRVDDHVGHGVRPLLQHGAVVVSVAHLQVAHPVADHVGDLPPLHRLRSGRRLCRPMQLRFVVRFYDNLTNVQPTAQPQLLRGASEGCVRLFSPRTGGIYLPCTTHPNRCTAGCRGSRRPRTHEGFVDPYRDVAAAGAQLLVQAAVGNSTQSSGTHRGQVPGAPGLVDAQQQANKVDQLWLSSVMMLALGNSLKIVCTATMVLQSPRVSSSAELLLSLLTITTLSEYRMPAFSRSSTLRGIGVQDSLLNGANHPVHQRKVRNGFKKVSIRLLLQQQYNRLQRGPWQPVRPQRQNKIIQPVGGEIGAHNDAPIGPIVVLGAAVVAVVAVHRQVQAADAALQHQHVAEAGRVANVWQHRKVRRLLKPADCHRQGWRLSRGESRRSRKSTAPRACWGRRTRTEPGAELSLPPQRRPRPWALRSGPRDDVSGMISLIIRVSFYLSTVRHHIEFSLEKNLVSRLRACWAGTRRLGTLSKPFSGTRGASTNVVFSSLVMLMPVDLHVLRALRREVIDRPGSHDRVLVLQDEEITARCLLYVAPMALRSIHVTTSFSTCEGSTVMATQIIRIMNSWLGHTALGCTACTAGGAGSYQLICSRSGLLGSRRCSWRCVSAAATALTFSIRSGCPSWQCGSQLGNGLTQGGARVKKSRSKSTRKRRPNEQDVNELEEKPELVRLSIGSGTRAADLDGTGAAFPYRGIKYLKNASFRGRPVLRAKRLRRLVPAHQVMPSAFGLSFIARITYRMQPERNSLLKVLVGKPERQQHVVVDALLQEAVPLPAPGCASEAPPATHARSIHCKRLSLRFCPPPPRGSFAKCSFNSRCPCHGPLETWPGRDGGIKHSLVGVVISSSDVAAKEDVPQSVARRHRRQRRGTDVNLLVRHAATAAAVLSRCGGGLHLDAAEAAGSGRVRRVAPAVAVAERGLPPAGVRSCRAENSCVQCMSRYDIRIFHLSSKTFPCRQKIKQLKSVHLIDVAAPRVRKNTALFGLSVLKLTTAIVFERPADPVQYIVDKAEEVAESLSDEQLKKFYKKSRVAGVRVEHQMPADIDTEMIEVVNQLAGGNADAAGREQAQQHARQLAELRDAVVAAGGAEFDSNDDCPGFGLAYRSSWEPQGSDFTEPFRRLFIDLGGGGGRDCDNSAVASAAAETEAAAVAEPAPATEAMNSAMVCCCWSWISRSNSPCLMLQPGSGGLATVAVGGLGQFSKRIGAVLTADWGGSHSGLGRFSKRIGAVLTADWGGSHSGLGRFSQRIGAVLTADWGGSHSGLGRFSQRIGAVLTADWGSSHSGLGRFSQRIGAVLTADWGGSHSGLGQFTGRIEAVHGADWGGSQGGLRRFSERIGAVNGADWGSSRSGLRRFSERIGAVHGADWGGSQGGLRQFSERIGAVLRTISSPRAQHCPFIVILNSRAPTPNASRLSEPLAGPWGRKSRLRTSQRRAGPAHTKKQVQQENTLPGSLPSALGPPPASWIASVTCGVAGQADVVTVGRGELVEQADGVPPQGGEAEVVRVRRGAAGPMAEEVLGDHLEAEAQQQRHLVTEHVDAAADARKAMRRVQGEDEREADVEAPGAGAGGFKWQRASRRPDRSSRLVRGSGGGGDGSAVTSAGLTRAAIQGGAAARWGGAAAGEPQCININDEVLLR